MVSAAFLKSSVGRKFLMGASGLMLVGFAVMHMLGNLSLFLGPDALNAYAEKLQHLGPILWLARGVLLAAVGVHIAAAVSLTRENRAARRVGYKTQRSIETTWAAKTMVLSGILLLVYIVYHLLHFTFGVTEPHTAHLTDALGRHDVYAMVVHGFQSVPVAAGYVAGMFLLSSHLSHGIASMFQSVGLNDDRFLPQLKFAGRAIALALFIGYSAIPVAVVTGLVKLPGAAQ